MANPYGQFRPEMTPQEQKEYFKQKFEQSPEAAKKTLRESLNKAGEAVLNSNQISPEERAEMAKIMADPAYLEKKEKIGYLFEMLENKGILSVASAVKNLDPSLEDAFHDVLVQYFQNV